MEEILINPVEYKGRQGRTEIPYFSVSINSIKVMVNQDAVKKLKLKEGDCLLFKKIGKVNYLKFSGEGQPLILNKENLEFSNKGFCLKLVELQKPLLPVDKRDICTGLKWQIGLECDKDGWYELIGEPFKLYNVEPKNTGTK